MEFTHTRLLVDDYPAALRFYRDTLGFAVTFGDEESGYADLDTGEHTLALFDRAELVDALGVGGDDRVMLVFAADVDRAYPAVRETGAQTVAAPRDRPEWGIRTAHLRDPGGTLLELNEPLPE